jgi:signal transduction histidine kinase
VAGQGGALSADAYAGHMARPASDDDPQHSAVLQWIAIPASVAVLVLVTLGVIHGTVGQSPPVIAAAAVALVVAFGGIGWTVANRSGAQAPEVIALTAAGLAGAVLVGLFPSEPGYLVVFVALLGLGMQLPPLSAVVTGLVIFAAVNLSMLLAAKLSVSNMVSENVGAAFLFAVGLFTRSTRVSQARARAAQARAEDLLTQLRASQAAQAQAATLTERTRVAREVHDILAHSLSGLVLALDTVELLGRGASMDRKSTDPQTLGRMLEQVARAQRIARDGLADTRRAISALRGDELPGPAVLDRLVRETSETTGIHATLTVIGEERPLSPEIGLALYRTAQEALINTAKYAGRDGRAELRLSYRPEDVELEIGDARSADAAPPAPAGLTFGGYGLTGMRERAELLGGRLTAGPTEEGFRVLLHLPTSAVADTAEAV